MKLKYDTSVFHKRKQACKGAYRELPHPRKTPLFFYILEREESSSDKFMKMNF